MEKQGVGCWPFPFFPGGEPPRRLSGDRTRRLKHGATLFVAEVAQSLTGVEVGLRNFRTESPWKGKSGRRSLGYGKVVR